MRREQRRFNIARLTGLEKDWAAYRNIKKEIQSICHKAYNNYVSSLLDTNNRCTKRFWSFIKSKCNEQIGIYTLRFEGKTYTQSTAKANILNKQFASVYTKEDQTSIPSLHGESFPDIGTLHIESNGIEKLLSELNPYKATVPDNIPSRFLKETAHYVALLLTFISIINQSRKTSS